MSRNTIGLLILGKLLVVLAGFTFGLLNWLYDPSLLVTVTDDCPPDLPLLPDGTCPLNESSIRAAGFTMITAVALFAGVFPTLRTPADKALDFFARFLGVGAAVGAGWYWLDAETYGHADDYLIPMIAIVAVALYTIATGTWMGASIAWLCKEVFWPIVAWFTMRILLNFFVLLLVWSVLLLIAIALYLWKTVSFVWRFLKATAHP